MSWRRTTLKPDNLINGLDKISQFPILPDLPPRCLPSAGTTDWKYAARSLGLICSLADIKTYIALAIELRMQFQDNFGIAGGSIL